MSPGDPSRATPNDARYGEDSDHTSYERECPKAGKKPS